ncbi:GAF domain-containing protein [Aquimarina hainanensis]|uniref:GAF domain-containing protein n=1 Tax=Aquimarina hainanensis TaxID=1578017 RepID=A0ABW5NCT5_9FLAO
MKVLDQDFPLDIWISFTKFFEAYRENVTSENELLRDRAKRIVAIADQYPELESGIQSEERIQELMPEINMILEDSFSEILQKNEIKLATIPFKNIVLKCTRRYENIIKAAGKDFEPTIENLDEDYYYIMGCSIILTSYYGYNIDFKRPFISSIPDMSGILRHYKILYNADFIKITKKEGTRDITNEDVAELLDNFGDIDLWKEKFAPNSWIFQGVIIANMFDVTMDVSLSNFKAKLLKYDKEEEQNETFLEDFQKIFKAIFNLPDIKIGFSDYNEEEQVFETVPFKNVQSYLLHDKKMDCCEAMVCRESYDHLFKESTYFAISDVEKSSQLAPEEGMYKRLLKQNIKSIIIAPIVSGEKLLGIMEIVSPNVRELNSINAHKLQDVMPYLVDSVLRSKAEMEDEMELVIQKECTSIHTSVYWKFREEAKRFLRSKIDGEATSFREVVFEDVYPLYGQIDIKGSSEARNTSIQKDLILQLNLINDVMSKVIEEEPLPIYNQLKYRIDVYIQSINEQFQVDSEQNILDFIRNEITPLFEHLEKKNDKIDALIYDYKTELDENLSIVYKHRKAYDESVMIINKRLADLLDKKQVEAQKMYPHYFERFKSDGVEHNMYVGESITKKNSFNQIYLHNLRLWQLQVMCEMENEYYLLKKDLPVAMDVASMALVFNSSLSVRFRMDEKRFDVDSTYNARYEVVKKRVDKANIKGTNKRVTEQGKLVIVYSQRSDEKEYMKYIHFLQAKNYLKEGVEIVELEDLQGVTGLKAIRVDILYHKNKEAKEFYTYEELMEALN